MEKKLSFINDTAKMVLDVKLSEKENVYPYLDIDFQPCEKFIELSICGTLCEKRHNVWREVAWGQLVDSLWENFPEDKLAQKIVNVWSRWHLNGLRAGSREQEEFLYSRFVGDTRTKKWRDYNYDIACDALKNANLYVIKKHFSEYTYGHAWLVEHLPSEVIAEVESWK